MEIKTGKGFEKLVEKGIGIITKDGAMTRALSGTSFQIGYDNDADFAVPASAIDTPLFMGDSGLVGEKIISPAAEAMLGKDPSKVRMAPVWNRKTEKFDIKFAIVGDDGYDLLSGQAFSPWNITYLSKIWKEPLAYSNAKKLIHAERAGSNPFAEIFTLFLEQYAGWGVIGQTGSLQNTLSNDVNVRNGMASFPIINMMGTYSVTLEEQRRQSWGPVGSSPVSRKQSYLNYVFDMMDAILILYGNEETGTPGILDINPVTTWASGQSIKDIATGTSATKGSDIYMMLAGIINDFLTAADNKWSHIVVGVSPETHNYLMSTPYSANFSPVAAMRTFAENYLAGKGPNGSTPTIEFVSEPLLKAGSELNPNSFDYTIISCPSIDGGPEKQEQSTNFYATVLDKFVFPSIPGSYNTQYKTLRRTAGVIAPIPSAVKVYAGLGVQ